MTPWEIKGRELVNCTCEYGCNCQFNALPDKGHCHAVAGIQIDEGHHGETPLDGLRIAAIFKWPGADPRGQRRGDRLRRRASRRRAARSAAEDHDRAGHRSVRDHVRGLRLDRDKMHEPVFTDIDFEVDVDGRKGRLFVKDYIEMTGEPIRNKVTGAGIARADRAAGGLRVRGRRDRQRVEQDRRAGAGRDRATSTASSRNLHLNNHGVVRA